MLPYTKEAYALFHKSALLLARMENNGIKIDVKYLEKAIRQLERKIKYLLKEMEDFETMKVWRRHFGHKTNVRSGNQLNYILFGIMDYAVEKRTKKGAPKIDEEALSKIDDPFLVKLLRFKKYEKALNTFLKGIQSEVVDGVLHPFFNLHIVISYRSSSDSPNFQNFPVRDPELAKIIRSCFVARTGRRLIEIDFSGNEIKSSVCYHQDPTMLKYLNDPKSDMHRDMAGECFLLPSSEVDKMTRYCAKNMFVFPQFFGDWYVDCAKNMWQAIDSLQLKTVSGMPLKEWLKSKGIKNLGDCKPGLSPVKGTFEAHIQQVENDFWNKRFKVYNKWKKTWLKDYHKKGYFVSKTGFVFQGNLKKNEALNYAIQGTAFHWLLWCLLEIEREIIKRGMRVILVGQIHDSLLADCPEEEREEFLRIAKDVMTRRLIEQYPWIIAPVEIEAEMTPIEGSWHQKKVTEI